MNRVAKEYAMHTRFIGSWIRKYSDGLPLTG